MKKDGFSKPKNIPRGLPIFNQRAIVINNNSKKKELENEGKYCQNNNECNEEIQIFLNGNPIYCDCNLQVKQNMLLIYNINTPLCLF